MNSEYQNGSMPMTFMKTNSQELDIHKLAEFERILNGRLTGNTAERHRIKVLPDGFDPVAMPEMADRFKSDYDEYIIKRVASIFGVSPATLGVVSRAGLGGGKGAQEGEAEATESVSTKPMEDYVVSVINSLSRRYLNADKNVTFVLNDRKGAREDLERSKALQTALFSGQKTLNDVQGELGQNLYDMPEADEPFIVAGNAITFLKGMLSVDTTGETVGQAETAVEANKPADAQPPKQSPVGLDIPAVGAPADQKSAISEELKDFGRFVKSRHKRGNWRAFDFTVFDAEVADNLNEQAYFIVKGATPMPENIYEWASDIVNSEITDTPKGLVTKREMHELPSYPEVEAVSKKHSKAMRIALATGVAGVGAAISQALRAIPAPLEDAEHMRAVAHGAVRSNVSMNNNRAVRVLKDIYTAGGKAGGKDAARVVRSDAVLAGRGLQSLLDKAGITIQGITQTTMTRISDSLLIGISEGMSARDIGTAIDLIINDQARADIIAVTETNRAYNASAVDTYQSAGIEQFDWLAYDGACDECSAQEDANPHDITDEYPPEHPSCRCSVAAVLPDTTTDTSTDSGE
jgi:SPP1 gp7 family putative phage head morphogenesis protein